MARWSAQEVAQRLSGSGKARSRKKGHGWMAPCPVHTDGKPSLSLTDGNKGLVWYCHAGCSQDDVHQALVALMGGRQTSDDRKSAPKQKIRVEPTKTVLIPPPAEAHRVRPETFQNYFLGMPSRIWTYRLADGSISGFVARYDTKDGKEMLPWSWCQMGAREPQWDNKAMPTGRPLYNLDKIAANPGKIIVFCEGEKAADAAEVLFPNWISTTNQGGSNALEQADLSSLAGRTVVIMPDQDIPGFKMMKKLCGMLQGEAKSVHMLAFPERWADGNVYAMAPGDDAADHLERGWTHAELKGCVATGWDLIRKLEYCENFGRIDAPRFYIKAADGKAYISEAMPDTGGAVKLVLRGVHAGWHVVAEIIEAEFNRRLEANRMQPGRFPRQAGECEVADIFAFELLDLFNDLQGKADPAKVENWRRRSYHARRKRGEQLLAA